MFLSICTPSYNRAYTLSRTYNSLKKQTCDNFEWIIIDDGSTDNTKELVDNWITEGVINIKYKFQQNRGKHIALNKGVDISSGVLFTCLDSDDWFYRDAVESIKKAWDGIEKESNIAGIIGLDTFDNKELVGTSFPINLTKVNWIDMIYKYKVKGDKTYVFVLDILRDFNFPSYSDDKHMPPSYQLFLLSEHYDFRLLNKPLKYVEYLEDGISNNIWKRYIDSSNNYALYRKTIMDLLPTFRKQFLNCIHLNSSLYLSNVELEIRGVKNKLLMKLTKPLGYLLFVYLKKTYLKNS